MTTHAVPRLLPAALVGLFLLATIAGGASFPLTPDEGRYVLEFSRGWRSLVAWLAEDNHPPLYFLFLKGWTDLFGATEWVFRLPGALFGAATVAAIYRFLREPLGGRRALVYTAFVAFNPLFLFVHCLGKYYGALGLLTVLAVGLMAAILYRRDGGPIPRGRLAAWGTCCLLLLWTHYLAIPMIAAMGLWLICEWLRKCRGGTGAMIATLAVAVAGFAPWIPVVLSRAGSGEGNPAMATLAVGKRLVVRAGYSAYAFAFGPTLELTHVLLYGLGFLAALSALAFGIYTIVRHGSTGVSPLHDQPGLVVHGQDAHATVWFVLWFVGFVGAASLVLMGVFLPGHPDLSMPERLAFLLPFVVLIALHGAARWPAMLRRVAFVAWAVPASVSVWNVYTMRENNSWDYLIPWREIAARIDSEPARPRTVLAIRREFAGLSWHYLRPRAEHFIEIDPMTKPGLADRLAPELIARGGAVFILRATRDATADGSIDAFTESLARHLGPPCATAPLVFESAAMRRLKARLRPDSPSESKMTFLQYCPDRLASHPH